MRPARRDAPEHKAGRGSSAEPAATIPARRSACSEPPFPGTGSYLGAQPVRSALNGSAWLAASTATDLGFPSILRTIFLCWYVSGIWRASGGRPGLIGSQEYFSITPTPAWLAIARALPTAQMSLVPGIQQIWSTNVTS